MYRSNKQTSKCFHLTLMPNFDVFTIYSNNFYVHLILFKVQNGTHKKTNFIWNIQHFCYLKTLHFCFLSAEYFWGKENTKFLMPFSWFKLTFYICIQKSWLREGHWHFLTLSLTCVICKVMVISQMFGALFHDEYPKDDISTQFNPLGSLFKSPVPKLGRRGTPTSQD